jgi:hypothetical protein
MAGFEALDDDELREVVKSLSITYDVIAGKFGRLNGRQLRAAQEAHAVCDSALTKCREELSARIAEAGG